MSLTTLWFINAVGVLLLCTYQDYKNKMMVDDRLNFYMLGISTVIVGMSELLKTTWWSLLAIMFLTIVINVVLGFMGTGTADKNAISWILLGLFYINFNYGIYFIGIYFGLRAIYLLIIRVLKDDLINKVPGFIVLLLSLFLLIGIII